MMPEKQRRHQFLIVALILSVLCLALLGFGYSSDWNFTPASLRSLLAPDAQSSITLPSAPGDPPTPGTAAQSPPPTEESGKQALREAREHSAAGRHAEAAQLLLQAANALPLLADGLLDEAARQQEAAGDYAGAVASLKILASRYAHRAVAEDALGRLGAVHRQAGALDQAVAVWLNAAAQAPGNTTKAYYWLQAAESLESGGQRARAAQVYQKIIDELAPNRCTVRAFYGYQRTALGDNATRQIEHALAFGLRMFETEAFQQAGPALDLAIRTATQRGIDLATLRETVAKAAYALYKTHANPQAIAYYEYLARERGADYADVLYYLSKLYTREGLADKARQSYRSLSRLNEGGGYWRYCLYQLALLDMEENRYGEAYRYFNQRLEIRGGNREFLEWLAAWAAYRTRALDAAQNHLVNILKLRQLSERSRYLFWQGRIRLEQGQKREGLALLRDLNRSQATEYYGWRSAEILKSHQHSAVDVQAVMTAAPHRRHLLTPLPHGWWSVYPELAALERVVRFNEAGLPHAAAAELGRIAFPKKMEPRHVYELAACCLQAQRYDLARSLALRSGIYEYLRNGDAPLVATYFPISQPLGYREIVEKYAQRFALPTALVLGIIFCESAFRPTVVSPAYAVGLMQILPVTGKEIAQALGEEFREESLYDPETNIRYGCWYLRHLLDTLGDDPAHAIAAYNAGPKTVAKWLRLKPEFAQDIFIDEIPYTETNKYVRKVMTAMKKYEVMLAYEASSR